MKNRALGAAAAGFLSIFLITGQAANSAVLEPDSAPIHFPAAAVALAGGPFARAIPDEAPSAAGTSLESAGFDLRSTGEFPSRMMDALAQSAAASDARLVGLMPISPEFAPLGVTSASRRGGQMSAGFASSLPPASKTGLLIALMAALVGCAALVIRRRGRFTHHPYAFGT